MAFKTITSLDADVTIALGGTNKKLGKPNPQQIEGFYLGKREVEDRKKKSGKSAIYYFQTPKGNVGVWGKTDLDRKMQGVTPGVMVRATCTGTRETPNGDMYTFKVEVDEDNTIEVVGLSAGADSSNEGYVEEESLEDDGSAYGGLSASTEDLDNEDAEQDAALAAAAVKAANKAKVQALLNGKGKKA